jgi:signal transduction histidine kinase
MRPLATARRITIDEDVAQGARVLVVPGFESVVRNLVDNAIKYSPPGGVVSVRLAVGEKIVLQVADTGGGIPSEVRDRIFRKFDRLGAEGGKIEGQGLGLSIVSSLVSFSGGTVAVGDRPDGKSGAVFTVELPAGKAPAPA